MTVGVFEMIPQIYASPPAAMMSAIMHSFLNLDGEDRRGGKDRRGGAARRVKEKRRGGDRSHLLPRRVRGDRRETNDTGDRRASD